MSNTGVGNFNNMGLNDYKTQVNSNMFNNMPNNYPGFNNPSDDQFANIPNNEPQNINNNTIL